MTDKKISVKFETVDTVDDRFTNVKIWLMHTGLNSNKSIFEKEVVEKALPSLKNTPILAYIEESRTGDIDFAGHEMEIVVKDGEMKIRYLGKAVGVIPDDCNPRWEQKEGDDGQLRDYLVVDGIVWNKFDEAVDILQKYGEVPQSMELDDKYDGSFDEEGNFVFTDFSFYGACLLGQSILPAMQRASVEFYSKDDKVFQTIQEKMNEYKSLFAIKSKEVERNMTIEELLAKYSTNIEFLKDKGLDISNFSIEELETKIQEIFEVDAIDTTDEVETADEVNEVDEANEAETETETDEADVIDESDEVNEKFTVTFELSHDDIRSQMWGKISSHMSENGVGGDESWFYLSQVYDSHVIVESEDGSKFYKVGYGRENDSISFGDVTEVHSMFLTSDEKGALELMRSSFDQYEKENAELKEFQSKIIKGQHESSANEIFSKFSKLQDEDIADIRENVHAFTLEEIESKLFEKLGRKTANFSVAKPNQSYSMKIGVNPNQENTDTSGYAHLFKKHGLS